ncbi:MAG: winged helix-turn-helix transcriptional regulator [Clostridia bacterium]|nr:winged helix-turn-helix transcriptional regulator [Clostridia bacterium]
MEKAIINKIIEINRCCLPLVNSFYNDKSCGIYKTSELVLFEIYSKSSFSANSIAKKLNLTRGYVGKIIKQHEYNGLLMRKESGDDRRILLLELTPKGTTYAETIIENKNNLLIQKYSQLSPLEQSELLEAFNTITKILK